MTQTFLSCYPIDRDNIETLYSLYGTTVLRTPGEKKPKFVVGKMLVLETILSPDLFDDTTTNVTRNSWICTREQFETKFVIVQQDRTLHGALIQLK